MSFLRRVSGLTLRDKVRSSDIQDTFWVQLLLLKMSPDGGVPGMSNWEEIQK